MRRASAHVPVDIERAIDEARQACGCHAGAVALVASTVAAFVWWVVARDGRIVMAAEGAAAFAAVVGTTVVAKFAAIGVARVRLRVLLRRRDVLRAAS